MYRGVQFENSNILGGVTEKQPKALNVTAELQSVYLANVTWSCY